MGNTLFLVGLVLAITLIFGTLFSLLLDQDFPGRKICRLLVIAPFFVMPTVSALIWKNMLMNPVFGLFAWITRSLGFGAIEFFSRVPLLSIVLIVGWEWTPFAVLILLAGAPVAESRADRGRPAGWRADRSRFSATSNCPICCGPWRWWP